MDALFKKLIPLDAFKQTLKRFPLAALCGLLVFVLLVLSIHDVIDLDDNQVIARLLSLVGCGFFWFVLVRLIAEGKGWRLSREYSVGGVVFAVLGAIVFSQAGFSLFWLLMLMLPALLLGIAVGPYIAGRDDLSFWFYNRQVWQGAAIALLAGVIWGGGISVALASIEYLFKVDIAGRYYADIWSFALNIFTPLYALSWVPRQYRYSRDDCHAPPQLAFVLNWVLAPLVIVYLLILYAYFIRIAVLQELPRGQLSYMVTGFGGLGVLTYLAGWPLRNEGGAALRLVCKGFFPALFLPVCLQALAIYQRIAQYGVTEQRYVIVVTVVWFSVLAILYSFRKPPLKFIPGLLAVLLVFAALGPFSATKVAERSQLQRLETLLAHNGILVNGRVVKTSQVVSYEDRKSISSILTFFQQRKKLQQVPGLSAEQVALRPEALTKQMGFAYVHQYERQADSNMVRLRGSNQTERLGITGFDYLLPIQHVYCRERHCSQEKPWRSQWGEEPTITVTYSDNQLTFTLGEKDELSFDMGAYVAAEAAKEEPEFRDLVMEQSQGNWRVRVIFVQINARKEDAERYQLLNFGFRVLIDHKP